MIALKVRELRCQEARATSEEALTECRAQKAKDKPSGIVYAGWAGSVMLAFVLGGYTYSQIPK